MNDKRSAQAWTLTEDGHRLGFWFPDDGSVRITINLPSSSWSFIQRKFNEQTLPLYRIDRDPAVDLTGRGEALQVKSVGSAIGWRVAESRDGTPKGELVRLLAGKRLLLRYKDADGESHDVTFSLEGADRAYKLATELQE